MKKIKNILVLILALLAIGIFVYIAYIKHPAENKAAGSDTSKVDLNPPTKEQLDATTEIKQQSIERSTKDSEEKTSIVTTITNTSVSGGILHVRAMINSVISGTCELSLSNGSSVINRSAQIQPMAGSSTCQGFDIPTSELFAGSWKISIRVQDSAGISSIGEGEVSI